MGFDYQVKVWGGAEVKRSLSQFSYLRLKHTLKDLELVKGRVVDVGCGGGGLVKAIKRLRPDLKTFGVDFSQLAIKRASSKRQGVRFQQMDLYRLRYRKEYFDAVIFGDVLEHLKLPKQAL
ncbi:MAG: methyltransferase domain-containing protein, partial [Thaumarchaeota archaeon]|nr:methyltransferase domain-containing protein [Nitrososphaerota archaeon]